MAVNIIALFAVIYVAGGVSADSSQAVVIAALVLGLLNTFFKPALIGLTLPLNLMTLGFFTLIINGFMFYVTSKLVPGFNILDFWAAFWAAIIFSIISTVLNFIMAPKINIRYSYFDSIFGSRRSDNMRTDDDNVIDVEGRVEDQSEGSK